MEEVELKGPGCARLASCLFVLPFLLAACIALFCWIVGWDWFQYFLTSGAAFLYGLSLLAAILVSCVLCIGIRLNWLAELSRVRLAVLKHLQLPATSTSMGEKHSQVFALVPCRGIHLSGKLAPLASSCKLWLCFLADRTLVIAGRSGEVIEFSRSEMERLYLLDHKRYGDELNNLGDPFVQLFRRATGIGQSGQSLVLESAGARSILTVDRVDDMVRVVNALVKQGIVLGYLKEVKLS